MWRRSFPGKETSVVSRMALPSIDKAVPFDPKSPLTVVVIGGAQSLGGLPSMRIRTHRQTYEDFLTDPGSADSRISLVFKPKPGWEDERWFAEEIGEIPGACAVSLDSRNVLDLDHPNMVFVSMTYASSALLEGITRGVPALVATKQQVENYVPVAGSPIPVVSPRAAWDVLIALLEPGAYDALSEAQRVWLRDDIFSMPGENDGRAKG